MPLATQIDFAAALLAAEPLLPQGLTSWNTPVPARRFAVYRNNVVSGLIGALQSRFPATGNIVGEEFFKAMAREYSSLYPPKSAVLLEFGNDFGDFAAHFEPAAGLPYLPDVIRLEIARGRAYHAADAAPLDPQRLSQLDVEQLSRLSFSFHPSTAIVRSVYPIVKIWAMNAGELPLEPIEVWEAEDALVTRPQLEVLVHVLPKGGADFLNALMSGAPLETAFQNTLQNIENFDLAATLACLFQMGAVTGAD